MDEKKVENGASDIQKNIIIYNTAVLPPKGQGLTLRKYLRYVVIFKYWIIGAVLLSGIAGYLVTRLSINSSREKLTSSFTYQTHFFEDTPTEGTNVQTTYTYLDGSVFNYSDIISSESIRSVQEKKLDDSGNQIYASVNVNGLISDSALSISQNTVTSSGTTSVVPLSFTITAPARYFGSESVGRSFIKDLIGTVTDKCATILATYTLDSQISKNYGTKDYELDMTSLSKEYSYLSETYQTLIASFDEYLAIDGKTLAKSYQDFKDQYYYSTYSTVFDHLNSELANNRYVRFADDTELAEKLKDYTALGESDRSELVSLNEKYQQYSALLDAIPLDMLESNANLQKEYSEILTQIRLLTIQRNNLVKELRTLGYVVETDYSNATLYSGTDSAKYGKIQHLQHPDENGWRSSCGIFGQKVVAYHDQLIASMTEESKIYRYLYTNYQNTIVYSTGNDVALSGHTSNWVGAIGAAFLGFVVVSFVGALVGNKKDNAERPETSANELVASANGKPSSEGK